ncbi:uncharacterized protein LOC142644548 [Castanea sativa]|uniref:uncharacterized protein LOC142644548 n=1 Tax=Castanea sativa TaxID=21020 RepID=UPI003F64D1A0
MVVKSKVVSEHVGDLRNIFEILRKHKLRLNASKCPFGVKSGKFLGYMVTHHGIKVNLDQLKEYLSLPPIMSKPEEDEVLFAYIVMASHIVSLVLKRVDSGVQRPVYYVSKSLHEAKVRYLPLEKAILAIVHATQRIAKWGTISGAFGIKYMPRTSIKGQVLANLVAEFAESPLEEKVKKQNMDGKSVGMVSLLGFSATNNEAEYEALLVGITMVHKMGGKTVEMFSDSRLVVGLVEGELEAKDLRIQEYLNQVRHLQLGFESFTLLKILRSRNIYADSLATLATSLAQSLPRVILVKDLCKPTEEGRDGPYSSD